MSTCSYTTNDKGIAVLTIDNPPMNALSSTVLDDIDQAFTSALEDQDVRVIIITGAGSKAFVAGADITEIDKIASSNEAAPFIEKGQTLFNRIEASSKPVIAALNGYTLGGGMELALACHMRVADEKAMMGLPEIKLGIIPGYGGTQRMPRLIGQAAALELILSGEFIPADRALDIGLVNQVAPAGTAVEAAETMAAPMAQRGKPAIQAALRAVTGGLKVSLTEGLSIEKNEFGGLCETENKKEGIVAFLEKRNPEPKDS